MRFLIITSLMVTSLISWSILAEQDDDLLDAKNSPVTVNDLLHLSNNAQQVAGIKTIKVNETQYQEELVVYGSVLSLEPLLQLRQQFLAAKAQQQGAHAKYNETELSLTRTQHLHSQDIVSTRRLQEQQALWQSEKANLTALTDQQNSILTSSRLQWGNILTDWFVLSNDKNTLEQFLQNKTQLLLITIPVKTQLTESNAEIMVDAYGQRENAQKAERIAIAPSVDPVSQGQRYFFKTTGLSLPFGSHLTAWIKTDTQRVKGIKVPKSAIVWYLGQALVFVKTADQHYQQRVLTDYKIIENNYFVSGLVQAGEEVVIIGAQTLLSQQLKALIPDEDQD